MSLRAGEIAGAGSTCSVA